MRLYWIAYGLVGLLIIIGIVGTLRQSFLNAGEALAYHQVYDSCQVQLNAAIHKRVRNSK